MSTATQTSDRMALGSSTSQAQLANIGSRLVKALVFEVLVILANAYGVFLMIGVIYAVLTEDNFHGPDLYFAYLSNGTAMALLAAGLALTVVVTIRTWRMLNAANNNDITALKKLSSLGWAVVAIFSSYIAPGIWLLRINGLIRSLDAEAR